MRNLVEYPPTKQEMLECLKDARREIAEQELIGDMRPLLLTLIMGVVDQHGPDYYSYVDLGDSGCNFEAKYR